MSGGQDRTMEGHPAGLRGAVGKEEEERGWEGEGGLHDHQGLSHSERASQCEGTGAQEVGPRGLSDLLEEAPQPRAQPTGNFGPLSTWSPTVTCLGVR